MDPACCQTIKYDALDASRRPIRGVGHPDAINYDGLTPSDRGERYVTASGDEGMVDFGEEASLGEAKLVRCYKNQRS